MSKRIGLIVNPTSGKNTGARIGREAAALLRRRGDQIIDLSGADVAEARKRGSRAVGERSIEVLVVVGGDGMFHLGANLCAGTGIPLGVVAAGTGNDISREFGLPVRDAVRAVRCIHDGTPRAVDLIRHEAPDGTSMWLAGVLAAGFDAVVNERANQWCWPKGQLRYTLAMLRELPVFRPIPYVITIDGTRRQTRAMLVAVANGPAYGGGMKIVPTADPTDGLLDVLILHEISVTELLRVFPKVSAGAHIGHPAVEVVRGRRVSLEAPGIVAYADGERFARLPLECEVVPGALRVLR